MSDLNKVTLVGNVVREPKRREESGEHVTGFVLATAVKEAHGKARPVATEFHECRATGKLGDIIGDYVRTGSTLYVEGHVRQLVGVARGRGSRAASVVEVENIIMLGHRSTAREEAA